MEYAYRQGGRRPPGMSAQQIGEYLESLEEKAPNRVLTPEQLLEDAKAAPEGDPRHDYFEWDDTVAGHRFRLMQARSLITSVKIVYRSEKTDGIPKTTRGWVSVKPEAGRTGYVAVSRAMSDEEARARTLRAAWNELQAFKRRYMALEEFARLWASVEDIESMLPPILQKKA